MFDLNDVLNNWGRYITILFIAILCGGILGYERELRGKPAGIRTEILICVGSALYMILSEILSVSLEGIKGDPTRIAAQIVTGVGFLGAGAIMHAGLNVTGLTTAAVIWVCAGIGIAVGAGHIFLGLLVTILILFVLELVWLLEKKIFKKHDSQEQENN